ncbi:MAG: N-ethylmaleimide-sensitive fusion protein [Edafosvirus sp.]|uniref:N-ethylmaleimide-sensitive fusion protein n=1 Tax=Edafosvirus sp. TaxID=2487765 RepID=A0A3G4ZT26_9VIRU|nr:MAG: N-ethylmaleimide-sensitive fusion protein [Edafosvirus sp.]
MPTNKVYTNNPTLKSNITDTIKYVQFNTSKIVYIIDHGDDTKNNEIRLNRIQKLQLLGPLGEEESGDNKEILGLYWKPSPENICTDVVFQLKRFNMQTRLHKIFNDDNLIENVISNFKDHVFIKNQIVLMMIDEIPYEIKVKEFKTNGSTIHALLNNETNILFESIDPTITIKSVGMKLLWNFEQFGIGGLNEQFSKIIRQVFSSRFFPPEYMEEYGVKHVKGMLLYGPPGTGKTLIARQMGKMLNIDDKNIKLVNGPEVLNKFVGESEKNIRDLFGNAEADQKLYGNKSPLHLIILDELDSIAKSRGTSDGPVADTVINQLLAKVDGVTPLNNILVIGMTNRKDMLDPALLRPGRLEVHVEIGLPNETGRLQIFKIHTQKMATNKLLSPNVDFNILAKVTKNYSGAEIESVVKSARSFALSEKIKLDKEGKHEKKKGVKDEKAIITMKHFESALEEVLPAYGSETFDLDKLYPKGFDIWGPVFEKFYDKICDTISQTYDTNRLTSMLLHGTVSGCGKTALVATITKKYKEKIPFIRFIRPVDLITLTERQKVDRLSKIFYDATKSPHSLIVLDNIDEIMEYSNIGARFSMIIYQALKALIGETSKNTKLLILATTSNQDMLDRLDFIKLFDYNYHIPVFTDSKTIYDYLGSKEIKINHSDDNNITTTNIPIRKMLTLVEMCKKSPVLDTAIFDEFALSLGLGSLLEEEVP